MEKTYNPDAIEQLWYQHWETNHYFSPNDNPSSYCIMLPPPNVTGSLHMGHGFQCSIMDALIRYHRMLGYATLWQGGTDHAGIATQMVVERQLEAQGSSRQTIGREAFLAKVHEWKQTSGGRITAQLRRLGCSMDWDKERFTMDDGLSEAVQEVFIRLYQEGLLYRGQRLVNWDPQFKSAISDLEVINQEEQGKLWHFRYPLADGSGYIEIATTRPETMLGDTAVAVHPEDSRYQHLIGRTIKLPLTDREIPIIADTYVDPEFGSGCVKITPAHDFNDYEIGQRHDLPMINILNPDATLNNAVPSVYRGLDRFTAREKIITDMTALGLLIKIDDHLLKVPRGDRSGTIIEPYLTNQWFVRTKPLAHQAIEVVKQGKIEFVPANWQKTYFQWMENIEDWCISRQLWWGHRIPAWYDQHQNIYVGYNEAEIRQKHQLTDDIVLQQDEDVLDTWFSSALWPFSTLGWPENTELLQRFYPTDVLVTGFDIIFFWVARMIMMGLKFPQQIPFKQVYITGLIRDAEGQKMSKSKGNILDPLDLIDGISLEALIAKRTSNLMQPKMAQRIEQATRQQFPAGIPAFGTDALRFTFCALATNGRDIRFDLARIESNRNFCNKLWNAARYVLMNTEQHAHELWAHTSTLSLADRWIRSKLQQLISQVHHYFKTYRFDLMAQALYEFTWNDYCDWYLELSKPILYGSESTHDAKRGTQQTLLYVLESLLRLLHPLMPFITEEIWQRVAPLANQKGKTIMLQAYPQTDAQQIDPSSEEEINWIKQIIVGIRTIRAEMNIAPSKQVPVLFNKGSSIDQQRLTRNQTFLQNLAKLDTITWLTPDANDIPPSATSLVGEMEILIPLAGLIDTNAETTRLTKEIAKLEKEFQRSQQKLNNPNYLSKAPAEVVEQEKTKLTATEQALEKLRQQVQKLRAIS
ncbi:MAG: valine--tRNA ligase [Gammaproteobacteria bacterium]